MALTLTCRSCKSPVDVPDLYTAPMIRCGICWTECDVPAGAGPTKPLVAVAKALPSNAAPAPVVKAAALPSQAGLAPAAPGMAKLDALLHESHQLLAATAPPASPKKATIVSAMAPAPAAVVAPAPPPTPPAGAVVATVLTDVTDAEVLEPLPVDEPIPEAGLITPPTATIVKPGAKESRRDSRREKEKPRSEFKVRPARNDDDDDEDSDRSRSSGGGLPTPLILLGALFGLALLGGGMYFAVSMLTGSSSQSVAKADPNGNAVNNDNGNGNANNPNPIELNPPPVRIIREPEKPKGNPAGDEGEPQAMIANPKDLPPPGQVPNPMIPPRPRPNRNKNLPPVEPVDPFKQGWVDLHSFGGYQVKMPALAEPRASFEHVHNENPPGPGVPFFVAANGQLYELSDPNTNIRYSFKYVDFVSPPNFSPKLRRIVDVFGQAAVQPCDISGFKGLEANKDQPWNETTRVVQVGGRIYIMSIKGFGVEPRLVETCKKKFFDSIQLVNLAGGNGNMPIVPNPNPGNGFRPENPPAPGPFGGGGGGGPLGGGPPMAGNMPPGLARAAHRIEALSCAVVLPKAGEVWTFSNRFAPGGKSAGLVRRYSYPGFAPRASYHLPYPVTYAAVDESKNRLVVAAVSKPDLTFSQQERSVSPGEVEIYDLKAILDGNIKERDDLRPLATLPMTAKIAGLEIAAGKPLVLSIAGQAGRGWKSKLTQLDIMTGKSTAELDLPDPAWRLLVSADGRHAYTADVPLSAIGTTQLDLERQGYILMIDVTLMSKIKSLTVPGTVFDMAITRNDEILATISSGGRTRLYGLSSTTDATPLTPETLVPQGSQYVGLTPDGTTGFISQHAGFGVELFSVAGLGVGGKLTPRNSIRQIMPPASGEASVPLGGFFHITPDGKYALFRNGLVLELTKKPS
ncbi:MAG: hypothetical protein ACRCZF_27465 [Gemmataceae bacterium]